MTSSPILVPVVLINYTPDNVPCCRQLTYIMLFKENILVTLQRSSKKLLICLSADIRPPYHIFPYKLIDQIPVLVCKTLIFDKISRNLAQIIFRYNLRRNSCSDRISIAYNCHTNWPIKIRFSWSHEDIKNHYGRDPDNTVDT